MKFCRSKIYLIFCSWAHYDLERFKKEIKFLFSLGQKFGTDPCVSALTYPRDVLTRRYVIDSPCMQPFVLHCCKGCIAEAMKALLSGSRVHTYHAHLRNFSSRICFISHVFLNFVQVAQCPCTLEHALADKGRFLPDFDCDKDANPDCRYNKGAVHCVRTGAPRYDHSPFPPHSLSLFNFKV